ncbi:MAG: UPF0280 family protein [Bacillota bacterium]
MIVPYHDRFYRDLACPEGMHRFRVEYRQTDLLVLVDRASWRPALVGLALEVVQQQHRELVAWCRRDRAFLTALEPYPLEMGAPAMARTMAEAGAVVQVGPMAAVAGAMAEMVGRRLLEEVEDVLVENGGDIFLSGRRPVKVALFAGQSPLSLAVAVEVDASTRPLSVCTSSGTVGPSLSFGRADAAVAVAPDGALADAAATALGNRVQDPGDIPGALAWARTVPGLTGALVIQGDHLGAWGELRVVPS